MMKNMKPSVILVLSITLLLSNSLTSIAQSDAEKRKIANEFSDKGREAAKKGNYPEAIEHYTVAIALDPHVLGYYADRGDAKLELKAYKAAIADYDIYIQKCTASINGRSQKLNYERSITSIAVSFAPNVKEGVAVVDLCVFVLPEVYNNRGVAKDRLGDKLGACNDFREACKLGASNSCKNSERICNPRPSPSDSQLQTSASASANNATYFDENYRPTNAGNYTYRRVIRYKEPIINPNFGTGYYGNITANPQPSGLHICSLIDYYKTGEVALVGNRLSEEALHKNTVSYPV